MLQERQNMSNSREPSRRRISLDTFAVALALALVVLVRLNWIPFIKW
jgi:hypothetical protein